MLKIFEKDMETVRKTTYDYGKELVDYSIMKQPLILALNSIEVRAAFFLATFMLTGSFKKALLAPLRLFVAVATSRALVAMAGLQIMEWSKKDDDVSDDARKYSDVRVDKTGDDGIFRVSVEEKWE